MVADDLACNPRPATVLTTLTRTLTRVYGDDVEVDYRGYEVTIENLVRLLTGRLSSATPRYISEMLCRF